MLLLFSGCCQIFTLCLLLHFLDSCCCTWYWLKLCSSSSPCSVLAHPSLPVVRWCVCVRARSFHFVLSWCLRMSFFLNMLLLLSCFIDFTRAQNLFGPVFDSLRLGRWVHMWFCFSLCVRVCVHFGVSFLRFLLHVPVSSTHRHTLKSCLTVLFFGGFFWLYCVCFCCDFCCGTLNS